jgi:hypothetical protein
MAKPLPLPKRKMHLPILPAPCPPGSAHPFALPSSPQELPKQTFAIRGHIVDRLTEEEDEEEAAK